MNRHNWTACAYCTQRVRKAEREHVFPRAWYPNGCQTERVFAPACSPCNREYGRVEDRLFFPLVACLPITRDSRGLFERAMIGFDPARGNTVRDVSYRRARRARIDREVSIATRGEAVKAMWLPRPMHMSELTTPTGLRVTGVPTVSFRPDDIEVLAQKLVRGCFFACAGYALPANVPVTGGGFTGNPQGIFDSSLGLGLQPQGRYPFSFGFVKADDTSGLWLFTLWGYVPLYGATGRVSEIFQAAGAGQDFQPVVVGLGV